MEQLLEANTKGAIFMAEEGEYTNMNTPSLFHLVTTPISFFIPYRHPNDTYLARLPGF